MKSLNKILSCITLSVLLSMWLIMPFDIVAAAVAVTFVPNFDSGMLTINFSQSLSGSLKADVGKRDGSLVLASDVSSGNSIDINASVVATVYGETIAVDITDSNSGTSVITTTTYMVPQKSQYASNPAVNYATEALIGTKTGSDLYIWDPADKSANELSAGELGKWSADPANSFRAAKVLESSSIPELTAEHGLGGDKVLHLRKVEEGRFWSDIKTIAIKDRGNAPGITDIDIDFAKEQLKPKGSVSLQYAEDIEGPYANLTTLSLAEKKNTLLGERLYLRFAAVATGDNPALASMPFPLEIPERALPPTESEINDLFDRKTEMFRQNTSIFAAGGTTYEYRVNKKDSWKPVPFVDGTSPAPIDLSKLGAGLDKGIKKLEIRRGGTYDSEADSTSVPTSFGSGGKPLMASESVKVDLVRPRGPKKADVKFIYADDLMQSPIMRVVLGDNIVGALVPADSDSSAPQLEIASLKNKKNGEFVPMTATVGKNIDGQTVYVSAPGNVANKCEISIGNSYAIRYAAINLGDDAAFASKPTTIKLGKQRKAGNYSYIPLTETMKGVKDGRTLYLFDKEAKFADIDPAENSGEWVMYEVLKEYSDAPENPFEPDNEDDQYVYFRSVGVDGKSPPGEISKSVKIPKRSPLPSVTLGDTKPNEHNQILIDMNSEKLMVIAGKIAYRLKVNLSDAKKTSWKIIKKAEMPLKAFIPRAENVTYEFIVAGDSKGSTNAVKSNSDPFFVVFEPRPENPVAEDISYDYSTKTYTANQRDLLISADGKTNWTSVPKNGTFSAENLEKPVSVKIAPEPAVLGNLVNNSSIGAPASAKAYRFKFAPTPAAPIASLVASADGTVAVINDGAALEWATSAKSKKWDSAADKQVKDGETIYVRTPASPTAPASKPLKLTWKAIIMD